MDRVRWAKRNLQYEFSDPALLECALTHRSASKQNNERLEFLGDAMLGFSVARHLYAFKPEESEGDLSRARAALVNESALAEIGRRIEVDTQLILGAGELSSGGAQRRSALADAVEALIGAVLIDGGAHAADAVIQLLFSRAYAELPAADQLKDAKTRLQEWLQARQMSLPAYAVENISGSDHKQVFSVVCRVAETSSTTQGRGSSRRRAEQAAAAAMLTVLNSDAE